MELRTFISTALLDILDGVRDAQSERPNGLIVPKDVGEDYQGVENRISRFQPVEFEVSVSVIERAGSGAKLNVVAAFIGGEASKDKSKDDAHVAKLKFVIPVRLPTSNFSDT